MDIRMVSIIIWNGKAYLPSNGRYINDGPFSDLEPVQVVNPTQAELVPLVRSILAKKPKLLQNPSKEEIKARRDILPRVTGAHNWIKLCQSGISYAISFSDDGYLLDMSRLDAKGRWEYDPNKSTRFPANTDLSVIVQTILEDLKTR